MVSAILILSVAALALALAWSLLRRAPTEIRSLQDWEASQHEIDVGILCSLLECGEERYLRDHLSRRQFETFQMRRTRLALRMLRLMEENAGMLMRLGELAKMKGDPILSQKADELLARALHLRWNLLLGRLCLYLKWVFPSWTVSVLALEVKYQDLMSCLAGVRLRSGGHHF
jgi:hypothetical protein